MSQMHIHYAASIQKIKILIKFTKKKIILLLQFLTKQAHIYKENNLQSQIYFKKWRQNMFGNV